MKKYFFTFINGLILGCIITVLAAYLLIPAIYKEKANSYYVIANGYFENDVYEALSFYYYSSTLRPDWHAPHLGIAKCFEKLNQYSLAIREYNKAIDLYKKELILSLEVERIKEKIRKLEDKHKEDID